MRKDYYTLSNFLIIIISISIYRIVVLNNLLENIDLYFDEAYYWGWSQYFAFGYYSKPPMIAWIISLFTSLCGESEFCLKLPSLLFYPLTSIAIYSIANLLFDKKIAFFSGVAFFTLPIVSISTMIISTDVLLLFFLALTILFFVKAIKEKKDYYFIVAGVFGGLGLLTKYNIILILLSLFAYLFASKENRDILKNPSFYIGLIVASLIYIPNLIWNYQNNFVSFAHTEEISQINRKLFHLKSLLEFLGSQFVAINPIFFTTLLYLIFKPKWGEERFKLLYSFMIFFFAVIVIESFLSRAFANWAFPTYVAGTILITYYLISNNKIKLLFIGLGINLFLMVGIYHFNYITSLFNIKLKQKQDPYNRVKGWESVAKNINEIIKSYPNRRLLFLNRKDMAEFIYYLKPHPFNSLIWNPKNKIKNHYHLTASLKNERGEDFILITTKSNIEEDKNITKSFKSVKNIGIVKKRLYRDFSRKYYIYYLKNFLGYK